MYIEEYIRYLKEAISKQRDVRLEKIDIEIRSLFSAKIKGELRFKNDSVLYFIEIVDVEYRIQKFTYGYRYLRSNKEIFRYDNAPHHKELENFPHHKHTEGEVISSREPDLAKVLKEITFVRIRDKYF